MRLPDVLTVDSLEAAYSAWNADNEPSLVLPALLPSPMPFCVEAPLLQLIASMSRKLNGGLSVQFEGISTEKDSYEASLKMALGNPHALCGWLMSSQIKDENGNAIARGESHFFSSYLDAMDSYDFLSTHGTAQSRVNLVCVQGANREFILPLYHEEYGKHVIRPYPDIRLLVQDILSLLAPGWTGKELRDVSTPLAQLVKELMENADWWARTDEAGVPYRKGKGFRVLSFRLVEVDEDNASIFGGTNSHLHNYLQTVLLQHGTLDRGETSDRERAIKKNTFVELSVVDSGPGLARRWLASSETNMQLVKDLQDIPLGEEESVIAECFQKWATSSHNSLRGIGLFSVARMLREKNGFMRLRTGRLAYLFGTQSAIKDVEAKVKGKAEGATYHRLADNTHVFLEDGDVAFFLRPWNKEKLRAVEGTSYSILLPV